MSFKLAVVFWCALCVLSSTMVAAFQPHLLGVKLPTSMNPGQKSPTSQADGPELEKLLENNQEWANEQMVSNPNYFKELATGQAPRYLWIGCSDSRVPAESLTSTNPGEVFVHRNIANQVVPNSPNFLSVLTYAIEYLKVEDIIVCGHYKCGGVAASSSDADFGPALEDWLINLREVFGVNQELVEGIEDPDLQQKRYVELNTQAQCLKLMSHPTVLKAQAANNGIPRIHGLVFDLEEGKLIDIHDPEGPVAASGSADTNANMAPKKGGFRNKVKNMLGKE